MSDYRELDAHCRDRGILWYASCWDEGSVDFIEQFGPPCYKVASACLQTTACSSTTARQGDRSSFQTGMSDLDQIDHAVEVLGTTDLVLLHTTSTYPTALEKLNLRVMAVLRDRYLVPVGYSGHEVGLAPSVAAAALGASMVERHITVDRALWGTDQSASVEPGGFNRMIKDIRAVETAMGDGVKRVFDSELPLMGKLRRVGNDA